MPDYKFIVRAKTALVFKNARNFKDACDKFEHLMHDYSEILEYKVEDIQEDGKSYK